MEDCYLLLRFALPVARSLQSRRAECRGPGLPTVLFGSGVE